MPSVEMFSPNRCRLFMKRRNTARKYMRDSGAMMAGVLEYLCQELCQVAGDAMHARKMKTIKPSHINTGVRSDDELAKMFYDS